MGANEAKIEGRE